MEPMRFDLNTLPAEDVDDLPHEHVNVVAPAEFDLNDMPMEEVEEDVGDEVEEQPKHNKFLSNGERQMIYNALLERSVDGNLKRSTPREVSTLFSVHPKTVKRIWQRAKSTPIGTNVDVSHRRTKNCGRKRVEIDHDLLAQIPLNRRTTVRSIGEKMNTSHMTIHRRYREGLLRRHSNAIKPLMKDDNKVARLRFCTSMLDTGTLPHDPKFMDMANIVHIDEKWFYMTKKSKTYYLLREEADPLRSCQSKNFIGKVMFLVAIARPRFDEEGREVFSGKIGVFPLVTKQPALRRSRNREAGTLETKPITSVTKDIIRAFLIEKVLPAIQALWPREDLGKTIFIQQDNARTHVQPHDEQFQMAAAQSGFDIRLMYQPPNSPDLNVLDLGFFRAIQSLQDKECAPTVDALISVVEKAFREYPVPKINHVFLTLQLCMKEIMRVEGSNGYKIPHINKLGLERSGCLPKQISCDLDLVEKAWAILGRNEE